MIKNNSEHSTFIFPEIPIRALSDVAEVERTHIVGPYFWHADC